MNTDRTIGIVLLVALLAGYYYPIISRACVREQTISVTTEVAK